MDLQITASEGQSPSESDEMASQLDSQKICHTLWDQLGSNFRFNRVFFFFNIFQIDIFFYISHNLILIEIRWLSYSSTTFCLWSEQKKLSVLKICVFSMLSLRFSRGKWCTRIGRYWKDLIIPLWAETNCSALVPDAHSKIHLHCSSKKDAEASLALGPWR